MENKEITEAIGGVKTLVEGKFTEQGNRLKTIDEAITKSNNEIIELRTHLDQVRKQQLAAKRHAPPRAGQVSIECAQHLGALALLAGVKQGFVTGAAKDRVEGIAKDFGIEAKAALTTSEIPLPTEFSGEVVELVSAYGAARQFGTVYPLGTGTVKLPYLSTDTTFTLNAMSASITEKSPAFTFVTFTPEKFGGLIRLPTELDEDSIVPIGQFLARYSARNIARAEDHNFFAGTGAATGVNGTVKGLQFSTIDNSKVFQMSSTKTAYSDATLADFRRIRAVVDAPVIGMGAYYMHPTFEQRLAGLNTAGDKPYNANGIQGASLDGFPIRWVDVMPAYSTSANVSKVFALFGDLSYQYLGVRGGPRLDSSRDAGFTTDEILIRALERFTIGLMAAGAIAGLETAAS